MKNGNFKKGKPMIIISGSALVGTILLTSCSGMVKKDNNGIGSVSTSDITTESTLISESISTETTSTNIDQSTQPSINYSFIWDDSTTERFSSYVEKELGIDLGSYIRYYGFTDSLNKVYTDYLKNNYGVDKDVESVPFSASNYFYTYMVSPAEKRMYRDYECFCKRFLSERKSLNNSFRNKLILSYLIQNNIALGEMIPIECFESLDSDFIRSSNEYGMDYFAQNPKFGNYNNEYVYSTPEVIGACKLYNNNLGYIFYTEGLKEQDIFKDPELCDILNQHLKTFYGENAIQIGQVPTREQYKVMFGEDPLDLSYVPGAVVNDSQVKGNAQVRYGDSIQDYTYMYPESTYDYYVEETETKGTSR